MSGISYLYPGQRFAHNSSIYHASRLGSPSSQPMYAPFIPPPSYVPQPAAQPVDGPRRPSQLGSSRLGAHSNRVRRTHWDHDTPPENQSSLHNISNPVGLCPLLMSKLVLIALLQSAARSTDKYMSRWLHLAVYAAKGRSPAMNSFVWALFACTDLELGNNPNVTLYSITPGASPGIWKRCHWSQNLLGGNGLRLVL
ncbi:uncharacterized protein PHACADRAFT_186515 [Phanerochaete carnosa HHB-10118-sp]|uniref:Uncharacterized protein n=1 Tax=Phanerochaete carnosa (strain HHB-10118-sp) TaxID=650164 RepID=K5W0H2_PHACS|nr:uncharacterized protein PHACADRAFT_186515 [Phanerochaete carnosa HHB-10118-sp]EKM52359.1 hypothetical protein PHACADRAFT_186515 [Phanerochaete carnosa HHB-10118-sp]